MEKENIQENYHESLKERKIKDTLQEIKEIKWRKTNLK